MLGTVEAERAFSTIHPGAVYLHMGRSYEVRELDVDGRRAIVEPFDGDWYTQPKKETNVYIDAIGRKAEPGGIHPGVELYTGEVSVSEQVIAYQRKTVKDQEVIDLTALNLPEQNFSTRALWYVLPDELAGPEALPPEVQLGALHAAEHSQIAVLPLLAMCDRWDIGGLSTNVHFQTGRPTIFIYDGHPGGVGIAERGFERVRRPGRQRAAPGLRVPVRVGLPVLRPEPEVRQPERAAPQGGAIELMGGILGRRPRPHSGPALMHRRFEGSADIGAQLPGRNGSRRGGTGFRLRLLGLMGLGDVEFEPLLFPRCRSIHTFGMKTPIDLVWLELAGVRARVAGLSPGLEPGRIERAPAGPLGLEHWGRSSSRPTRRQGLGWRRRWTCRSPTGWVRRWPRRSRRRAAPRSRRARSTRRRTAVGRNPERW